MARVFTGNELPLRPRKDGHCSFPETIGDTSNTRHCITYGVSVVVAGGIRRCGRMRRGGVVEVLD